MGFFFNANNLVCLSVFKKKNYFSKLKERGQTRVHDPGVYVALDKLLCLSETQFCHPGKGSSSNAIPRIKVITVQMFEPRREFG